MKINDPSGAARPAGATPDGSFPIHGLPFFAGLSPAQEAILAPLARRRRFATQTQVFHAGDSMDEFHLILAGEVEIETPYLPGRGVVEIERLGVGEVLGCTWIFCAETWQFTARAVTDVQTVCFETAALRAGMEQDHDFGYEMTKRVGQVVFRRLHALRDILFRSCEGCPLPWPG